MTRRTGTEDQPLSEVALSALGGDIAAAGVVDQLLQHRVADPDDDPDVSETTLVFRVGAAIEGAGVTTDATPQPGSLGTADRPAPANADLLDGPVVSPLSSNPITSLVGLATDDRESDSGVLVFSGDGGEFEGEAVLWLDGVGYPVQSVEYQPPVIDRRAVTEWHLGSERPAPSEELPNGTEVFLQVEEDWVGVEFEAFIVSDTLQVEEDWVGNSFS